jgi:hypothetical protein
MRCPSSSDEAKGRPNKTLKIPMTAMHPSRQYQNQANQAINLPV